MSIQFDTSSKVVENGHYKINKLGLSFGLIREFPYLKKSKILILPYFNITLFRIRKSLKGQVII